MAGKGDNPITRAGYEKLVAERDRLCGSRAQIDLVEFTH